MKNSFRILSPVILLTALIVFRGCDKRGTPADLKLKLDKYVEYWNTTNFKGIEDLLNKDFELIESPQFEPKKGIENFRQNILAIHKTYPDFHLSVNEWIYDKDKVAGIWTVTATKKDQSDSSATSGQIKVTGISVIHFKDGKIKDEWIGENDYYWMKQLGYTFVPPSTEKNKDSLVTKFNLEKN